MRKVKDRMSKIKLILIFILFILIFFMFRDATKHFQVSYVNYYPAYAEFHLTDNRVFVATLKDNPYYINISADEMQSAKHVYFYEGMMCLEGTGEEGMFISKGNIRFKVRQIR